MISSVLVVAEQPLAGESIRQALRSAPACRVVGRLDAQKPISSAIAGVRPRAIVIDSMRSQRLLALRIREARAAAPTATIIFVSTDMLGRMLTVATEAGVDAVISRSVDPSSFATLVSAVVAGNVFSFPADDSAAERDGLTAREVDVLRMVAGGASNLRIAESLSVTQQTVKYHLTNVYRKVGVRNRTQASRHAHVHGYLRAGGTAHGGLPHDAAA